MYRLIPLFALLMVSFPASAQWSFDVSAGISHSSVTDPLFDKGTCCSALTLTEEFSGAGPRLALGVGYGDHLRFEVGYARFGDASGTIQSVSYFLCPAAPCLGPPIPIVTVQTVRQRGSARWFAITPSTPLAKQVDAFIKLGGTRTEVESFRGTSVGFGERETDTSLLLGLGVAWRRTDSWALRLEFERHGSTATTSGVSASYRF